MPPKPRSRVIQRELTRLPRRTNSRRVVRLLIRWVARLLLATLARVERSGEEHFPTTGPAVVITNHLGDADAILGAAYFPRWVDGLAKVELYDLPFVGKLMDSYGVIWIHRGQPDRTALRVALQSLQEGRLVAIAPEGRESLTGELEQGTGGAAYLALRARVPVVPVTFTGTENRRVIDHLKRLRRTPMAMIAGPAFDLDPGQDFRAAIRQGTQRMMLALARQLPGEYRGVYGMIAEDEDGGPQS